MKILVVDDAEAMLLLMVRFVEALGHEAVAARNGLEAVEVWRRERPDLVLLDMIMPVMSGPEAASILKQEAAETWLPIVFVTGVGEENALADAIELAADDYIHKPVNFRVLEAKLKAFQRTLDLNRKVREQSAKLADYYEHAEEEKRVVHHLMEQMVNAERLADPALEYWLSPAESLSGDLIAAARTPGKVLHVLLADGIGHGITAALNVLPLTQPFYSMTEKGFAPSCILVEMNKKVRQVLPAGRFVAVTLFAIDEFNRCIDIWNGGMPELQVLNQSGEVLHSCKSFSLPLGIVSSDEMDFTPQRYHYREPGFVLACSDGLIEARNATGCILGLPQVMTVLCGASPFRRMLAVQQAFSEFMAGATQHDDVSMLLASFGGKNADIRTPMAGEDVSAMPGIFGAIVDRNEVWRYTVALGADELKAINIVPFMMSFVTSVSELSGSVSDVFLILSELFSNALEHGVLGLESPVDDSTEAPGRYLLEREQRLARLEEGGVEIGLVGYRDPTGLVLQIRVKDSGAGFDWRTFEEERVEKTAGRGIARVQSLCANLRYSEAGNEAIALYIPRNFQQ